MTESIKLETGTNAQKVWNTLNKAGEITIQELCRVLAMTFDEVILAVGMLARNTNIGMDHREGQLVLIGK